MFELTSYTWLITGRRYLLINSWREQKSSRNINMLYFIFSFWGLKMEKLELIKILLHLYTNFYND